MARELSHYRAEGWAEAALPDTKSLGEMLRVECPKSLPLMDGLVTAGKTTYVHVSPRVESGLYAAVVSFCIATRRKLAPYGAVSGAKVMFCSDHTDEGAQQVIWRLIVNRETTTDLRDWAEENVIFARPFHSDGTAVELNSRIDKCLFVESIPEDIKLIVFPNIDAWISKRTPDPMEATDIPTLFSELNRENIAVLVFVHSSSKLDLKKTPPNDGRGHTVWLTPDSAAPVSVGGGFCVHRRKTDEEDTIPTQYRFGYAVIDGKLRLGWELSAQASAAEAKQIAIAERRIQVAKLLAENMPQKAISALLGVDPATVSRDAAHLNKTDAPPLTEEWD